MAGISFNISDFPDNNPDKTNNSCSTNESTTAKQSLFLKDLTANLKSRQAKEEVTSLFARFNNNNDDCLDERDGENALENFNKIYSKYITSKKPNIDKTSLESTANENIFYDKDADVYLQKTTGKYKPLFEVTEVVNNRINKTIQNGKINFSREYSNNYIRTFINLKEEENQEFITQYKQNILKDYTQTKETGVYQNRNTGEFYMLNEQTLQIEKLADTRKDENGNIYRIQNNKYIINGIEDPEMTETKYNEIFPKEFLIAAYDFSGIKKGDKVYEKNGIIYANGKQISLSRQDVFIINDFLKLDTNENLYYKRTEKGRQYKIYDSELGAFIDVDLNNIHNNNKLNGKIENFSQDGLGDCYLLSSINLLKATNPEALDKVLEPVKDENDNMTSMKVHFFYENRNGKIIPYEKEYTKDEILKLIQNDPDLSDGDMDINVIEITYENFRNEILDNRGKYSQSLYTSVASGSYGRNRGIDGGTADEALLILTGIKPKTYYFLDENSPTESKQNYEKVKNTIKELLKTNKAIAAGYYSHKNEGHGVIITKMDDNYIYIVDSNPLNGKGHNCVEKRYPIHEFIGKIHTLTIT